MRYMLMIYENEAVYGDGPDKSGAAMAEVGPKHMAFGQSLPEGWSGAGLKNSAAATTLRTAGGAQTLHDGPFAETKEQLGGFYVVDAPDLDAAIAIARRVPLYRDGAVEIRPLMTPPA